MMDSQATGYNNELLVVDSDKILFTIKGRNTYLNSGITYEGEESTVRIISNHDFTTNLGETKVELYNTVPLFYEQRNYLFTVESDTDDKIEVLHDNVHIRTAFEPLKRSNTIIGNINFRNQIGYSDFKIMINGQEYLNIRIEVFPSKIDYKTDYIDLVTDISNEIYNLAFDFFKRTYQNLGYMDVDHNSDTEFFSILNTIYDKYTKSIDIIINHAHRKLQVEDVLLKDHKIKRVNNKTIKWINKNSHKINIDNNYDIYNSKLLTQKKYVSYDTFENRFVRFMILDTIKRLNSVMYSYSLILKNENSKRGRKRDEYLIRRIELMIKTLRNKIDRSFLKHVSNLDQYYSMSLVFAMAPGYKDLYYNYMLLKKGLHLSESLVNISFKDTAELYEYWCFIKLNSLLKDKYELKSNDVIKIDNRGLYISLNKGAKVTYKTEVDKEEITLSYNKTEKKLPTVAQKPDNLLSLKKLNGAETMEYIFDAKYKIDMALKGSGYHNVYGQPGPKEEDINTMHRYRDAIVSEEHKRRIYGAYVLFPLNDISEYKNHKFYRSIDSVGVGGLPFMPNNTKLVEDKLDYLVKQPVKELVKNNNVPRLMFYIYQK